MPKTLHTIFVAPNGDDSALGTEELPFATLQRAQVEARTYAGKIAISIQLREGKHYLKKPLKFDASDSGTTDFPVVYQSAPGEHAVVCGSVKLALVWEPYKGEIMRASLPHGLKTEELFVDGERQILARYPNFDPSAKYYNGFAHDAISRSRSDLWSNPKGGYFHAMHPNLWGGFTWKITGRDESGALLMEGGWQNNRSAGAHETIRFVENVFEELDAPGEWFLDSEGGALYFYPPEGLDLSTATVEAAALRSLVEFQGTEERPVRHVHLMDLSFQQTQRTVMDTKEPLLRTDWAIYRGGAIFVEATEDCGIERCHLKHLGGNAIFVNNYNRRFHICGCELTQIGANGVCFVGDPNSVRSPLFNYIQVNALEDIDTVPGPLTANYPADCVIEECLIHLTGRLEKQTAGVEVDIAQNITIRHCSIYDMPRAGINVGDGCFGGHKIEFCDVFDTVLETGDHGSYNSWGRDRFWRPNIDEINSLVKRAPDLPLLDVVNPITLRNNRWRCDHGWDIDLDDGSTNYQIIDNLCLGGGIKNREGYFRMVENNITVNNTFHPHVWPLESQDRFCRNIVFSTYEPAGVMPPRPWGQEIDFNLLHVTDALPAPAKPLQELSGRDSHSMIADAHFVDAPKGDFRVRDDSPAHSLGFKNFPMDRFGVQTPALRAIARSPLFSEVGNQHEKKNASTQSWQGATLRNICSEGDMSAYGTPGISGVLVVKIAPTSPLAKSGIKEGDVILGFNERPIDDLSDLVRQTRNAHFRSTVAIEYLHLQGLKTSIFDLSV